MTQEDKRIEFTGPTREEVLFAATQWMSDFTDHGPIHISSVSAKQRGADWVAVMIYKDAVTPRS